MTPKEWSKFLRDLSDRENEKGEATITVCAALLDASKLIGRLDDSIDYLENSVSAHEENNIKLCRDNVRLRAALERIERRGLEIISEHVDGSDASYVAQELTALARAALKVLNDDK